LRTHGDGIERGSLPAECFVQGISRDTGILRNLRHAPRASNIAERRRQRCRVVLLKNGSEVRRHVFFAVEVLGRVKLREFGKLDFLGRGSILQRLC